ncbi:MAG: hypothetical protein KDA99_28680, partial [Planctomycetales bacterium]|nr:hypothetical protein [Planctomycetales bacterium]
QPPDRQSGKPGFPSVGIQQVTETASDRCSNGCSSVADLMQIADELRTRLSADECRRLAGLHGQLVESGG